MTPSSTKKPLIGFILSVFMTALLLVAVFAELTLTGFTNIIANIALSSLHIYIFLNLMSLLVRARRSQLMVRSLHGAAPRYRAFLLLTAIRNAFVDLLPARLGELSYVYILVRFGIPALTGFSTFLLAIALDLLVLMIIVAVSLKGYAATMLHTHTSPFLLSALMLAASLFLLLMLYTLSKQAQLIAGHISRWMLTFCEKYLHRLPRASRLVNSLAKGIAQAAEHLTEARKHGTLWLLLAHTFALRVLKYTSLYVLLVAVVKQWNIYAEQLPFVPSALAFVFAEGAASLPISGLMGFGAYEGTWSLIFHYICNTACAEVSIPTVAFVIHVITQAVGYSVGLVAILIFLTWEWKRSKAQ